MKEEILFRMPSPMRDDFKIRGFRFGSGEKTLAIVGAMRGDELQQQFVCSQMVRVLQKVEADGNITEGQSVLVIPNANHFSMNIGKRFWAMDNTDINRMFPGYDKGETTQRIAAAFFDKVKDYKFGIQLASFYVPGDFIPHIRMMETGYQPQEEAALFGLPYIYVKRLRPFDTTILNYNWQVWETKAFSLYSGKQSEITEDDTREACLAILRFMVSIGIIKRTVRPGYNSTVIHDGDLQTIRSEAAGVFYRIKGARDEVRAGEEMARILDPYDASVISTITSPKDGYVFFAHDKQLVLQDTMLYKVI